MLQNLSHLCDPALESFQYVHFSPVLDDPELDPALQCTSAVLSKKGAASPWTCWQYSTSCSPGCCWHSLLYRCPAGSYSSCLPGTPGHFLSAASQSVGPQAVTMHGFTPCQAQDFGQNWMSTEVSRYFFVSKLSSLVGCKRHLTFHFCHVASGFFCKRSSQLSLTLRHSQGQ